MLVYGVEVPDSEIALMRMPRAESRREQQLNAKDEEKRRTRIYKAYYYQRNKERLRAYGLKYYNDNKDDPGFKTKKKESNRRYREAHREEINAHQRAYYRRKKLEGLRTGNGDEHEHEQ